MIGSALAPNGFEIVESFDPEASEFAYDPIRIQADSIWYRKIRTSLALRGDVGYLQ